MRVLKSITWFFKSNVKIPTTIDALPAQIIEDLLFPDISLGVSSESNSLGIKIAVTDTIAPMTYTAKNAVVNILLVKYPLSASNENIKQSSKRKIAVIVIMLVILYIFLNELIWFMFLSEIGLVSNVEYMATCCIIITPKCEQNMKKARV